MKVRFGFTIGPDVGPRELPVVVDDLERLGFDSIWVPDVLLQPTLDPLVTLSYVAARTARLKLGSHLILPGKHPVVLARQLAHLDQLAAGRLLLLGVLGIVEEAEAGAQGIAKADRGGALSEMLPLMRRLWAGETVHHDGPRYPLHGVRLERLPVQEPLEMWLAGQAPAALRRCGALGDGWMPGLVLPEEAATLRRAIEEAAAGAGRRIDAEHYGANLFYATSAVPAEIADRFRARRRGRNVDDLVPVGWPALRDRIAEWNDAGFSKFLLRPIVEPRDWTGELERLADEVLPLTT